MKAQKRMDNTQVADDGDELKDEESSEMPASLRIPPKQWIFELMREFLVGVKCFLARFG